MSTPTEPARPALARVRDDLMLGSVEQDYILRIEPTPAKVKGDEDRAAALTVCGELGNVYPHLTRTQVVTEARRILGQLGLLDDLILRGQQQRVRAA